MNVLTNRMVKKPLLSIMLLILVLFTACGTEGVFGSIVDDMFGWIPGYQSSNTVNNNVKNTATTEDRLKFDCTKKSNSHEDSSGTCVCNTGYTDWYGSCVKANSNQCKGDWDCGKPSCSGNYKLVPRCDLRTETCILTEKVDCKTEYGNDYTCSNGNCLRIMAPIAK